MVRSLLEVSVADFAGEAACFLFDHQIAPPRTARTATAIRSPFGFIELSPLPPGGHADCYHTERENHETEPEYGGEIIGGEVQRPVLGRLGTDGNQILV